MPPFREESMCTRPKRSTGTISQSSDADGGGATMDEINLGQNVQNGDGGGRAADADDNGRVGVGVGVGVLGEGNDSPSPGGSGNVNRRPVRMRHRGLGGLSSHSSSSSGHSRLSHHHHKAKNGRHITNINRINVINNYGTDGGGNYFSTPRNAASGIPKQGGRASLGWLAVRVVLALLMAFWFGFMVTILRSARSDPSSQDAQSKAEPSLTQWKRLSEHMSLAGVRGGTQQAAAAMTGRQQSDAAAERGGEDDPNGKAEGVPAIFELSMFGNQSPSDFQLYTPHAPSCSKSIQPDDISFTLVSQLSNDRLWMVRYHCERWGNNPMSLVVFSDRTSEDVKADLVSQGCSEEHVAVQTVSPTKYDPTGTEYPVNLLRNIAFAAVKTTHIVYADVDFWPSSDLHSTLMERHIRERFASDHKLATVVPVFQMFRRCKEYKDCRGSNIPAMPRWKNSLFGLIKKKQASTFDPTNVGGHGSTKYITWRDQDKGTFVDLPCIKSNRYEPYLAFRYCSDLPPFQEGFTGYGKNKMTWVMQLRRAGYLFSQLGGVFLVHYPHLDSKARREWDKKPYAMEKYHKTAGQLLKKPKEDIDWGSFKRARVDALFLDFKEWLDGTVEDQSRVPMCEDALNDDVRLWVHPDEQGAGGDNDDDDEAEEGENADDGEYFEEYSDYVKSKETYTKCQEAHTGEDMREECLQAATYFIESSVLWSLVGAESGYLGPTTQMEYLVEAEECAKLFLEYTQQQRQRREHFGRIDATNEAKSEEGDYSFQNLVADLYTNMGVVAKNSHSKAHAMTFVHKALELNPDYESAWKILAQLITMDESSPDNSESGDEGHEERLEENSGSDDGVDVEEDGEGVEGVDAEGGENADGDNTQESTE